MTDTSSSVVLSEHDKRQIREEAAFRRGESAPTDDFEMSEQELAAQTGRATNDKAEQQDAVVEGRTANLDALPKSGLPSGRCPHCGERTEVEGVMTATEVLSMAEEAEQPEREYTCGDCGGEWGPKTTVTALSVKYPHQELPKSGRDGECPHCGVSTWKGDSERVTEFHELSPGSQRDTDQEYTCNECAGEWGPIVERPKTTRRPSGSSNGLKIEQDRESRNGVTRPSIGGKCRAVWDGLDTEGTDTTAKRARELADANGWDRTTTMVQFYKWRKFNGITGRQQ